MLMANSMDSSAASYFFNSSNDFALFHNASKWLGTISSIFLKSSTDWAYSCKKDSESPFPNNAYIFRGSFDRTYS